MSVIISGYWLVEFVLTQTQESIGVARSSMRVTFAGPQVHADEVALKTSLTVCLVCKYNTSSVRPRKLSLSVSIKRVDKGDSWIVNFMTVDHRNPSVDRTSLVNRNKFIFIYRIQSSDVSTSSKFGKSIFSSHAVVCRKRINEFSSCPGNRFQMRR